MNEFDVEFLLKLIKKLSVGRDFPVHVLDDVTNVGIEGHGHVVGKVVGDAFSFLKCKWSLLDCIHFI